MSRTNFFGSKHFRIWECNNFVFLNIPDQLYDCSFQGGISVGVPLCLFLLLSMEYSVVHCMTLGRAKRKKDIIEHAQNAKIQFHPTHARSSIQTLTDSKGPDQSVQMRRLIWAFAVHICPKTRFRMHRFSFMPHMRSLVRVFALYIHSLVSNDSVNGQRRP